jgi:uncharacterized protein YgbK (DUF1537 family)
MLFPAMQNGKNILITGSVSQKTAFQLENAVQTTKHTKYTN